LHHLANPARVLGLLAQRLSAQGTMRIMVYNSAARHWIHHLQRLFALLKISPFHAADIKMARALLDQLSATKTTLSQKISQMGFGFLRNR